VIAIGLFIFGFIDKTVSKCNPLEIKTYPIEGVELGGTTYSNTIELNFEGKNIYVDFGSSEKITKLILHKELWTNSYVCLEYRKGILNTYIIENKEIIIGEK
jgi:hypothetical protein